MERIFLSHSSSDTALAVSIAAALQKCVPDGVYCYENTTKPAYAREMSEELSRCSHMLVLVGDTESEHQDTEVRAFYDDRRDPAYWYVVDCRSAPSAPLPSRFKLLGGISKHDCNEPDPAVAALDAAREAAERFGFPWKASDGLPANPHLFDYEKDIIEFFSKLLTSDAPLPESYRTRLLDGTPPKWPTVHMLRAQGGEPRENPPTLREHVGEWRDPSAKVLVAALSKYHEDGVAGCEATVSQPRQRLCLLEAGPRETHIFPQAGNALNVGILVSGGIAPGINAVIDGITSRHYLYATSNHYLVQVNGLLNGFHAFDERDSHVKLVPDAQSSEPNCIVTADHASSGGSMLGTSRVDALIEPQHRIKELEDIVAQAFRWPLDILYVIGGDGSMKAAHAVWSHSQDYARRQGIVKPLSVVGIPKTMDNDILWVWQSFGFLSAVEKAREVIQDLHTEVSSNPRLCVVQLFGSDSGFVVSHAVLASQTGTCDAALIPEVPFDMKKLTKVVMNRMARRKPIRGRIPAALVVMAETAIPEDALDFVDDPDIKLLPEEKDAIREFDELRKKEKRIQGQTNEWLRSAGLKIVSRGLEKLIKGRSVSIEGDFAQPDWDLLRVFTNEPRHVLRAIPPSCMDIISGHRLGTLAVDNALAGYTDFMLSQWLTEYVLVPLELVVLGRKRIPRRGVFWRSVKSKTGQGDLA